LVLFLQNGTLFSSYFPRIVVILASVPLSEMLGAGKGTRSNFISGGASGCSDQTIVAAPKFSENGREMLRPHGTQGPPFSIPVPHHARSSSASEQPVAKGCVRA